MHHAWTTACYVVCTSCMGLGLGGQLLCSLLPQGLLGNSLLGDTGPPLMLHLAAAGAGTAGGADDGVVLSALVLSSDDAVLGATAAEAALLVEGCAAGCDALRTVIAGLMGWNLMYGM